MFTLWANVSYHIQLCFSHFYQLIRWQYGFYISKYIQISNNLRKSTNFTTKFKPPWMDIEKYILMLTSLLLSICVWHFILCHFCFMFILRFPLWRILIISWFPPCSDWLLPTSLVICTGIWNSIINKRRKKISRVKATLDHKAAPLQLQINMLPISPSLKKLIILVTGKYLTPRVLSDRTQYSGTVIAP